MAATVTQPQKKLLQRLLKVGRWHNESEIVRYGIELVRREVERESLKPLTDAERKASYAQMDESDFESDRALGNASLAAQKGRS